MRTLLMLLVLAAPALGQCPGDVNGDRRVTVAELVQAVNAALDGCDEPTPSATARPTATPVAITGCPVRFTDDNTADEAPACWFTGSASCGPYRFYSNGTTGVLVMDTDDGVEYYALDVDSPTTAAVTARWTHENLSDIVRGNVGGVTLSANGKTMDGGLTGTKCGRIRSARYEDTYFPARGVIRAMLAALH